MVPCGCYKHLAITLEGYRQSPSDHTGRVSTIALRSPWKGIDSRPQKWERKLAVAYGLCIRMDVSVHNGHSKIPQGGPSSGFALRMDT